MLRGELLLLLPGHPVSAKSDLKYSSCSELKEAKRG